jgi:hypothetical protein
MGAPEEAGKAVTGMVEALKSTPVILAILIFNVVFMGLSAWQTHTARAAFVMMLQDVLHNCVPQRPAAPREGG